MKRFDDAISYYALTLELYKREIEAGEEGYHEPALLANIKFRLGWAMVRSRSDIEEGIDWLKEAQREVPENPEVMVKLAGVLFKEKADLEESLMHVEKIVLEIKPSDYKLMLEAYLLLGKILERKNQYSEAIEALNQYLKIESENSNGQPPKANIFFMIGECQEKSKDIKKAILSYKKCLTIDNKHFNSCIHLANLLANVGEGQRAAKYFKHAIKIDPDSVNGHFGLGKALQ